MTCGMENEKVNKFSLSRCKECGEFLGYGRVDKKFCCRQCKNKYHNRMLQSSRAFKSKVLRCLGKNYKILDTLLLNNVTALPLVELEQLGFNMKYITSYSKIRRHDEYTCFDIKFTIMSSEVMNITKMTRTESRVDFD